MQPIQHSGDLPVNPQYGVEAGDQLGSGGTQKPADPENFPSVKSALNQPGVSEPNPIDVTERRAKVNSSQNLILVDLAQRASETSGGMPVESQFAPCFFNYPPPWQALRAGLAQLTCNTDAGDFRTYRENKFGQFFHNLCQFASDESVCPSFRAHVCSLAIAINNTLDENEEVMAVYYAEGFLNIAKDVNNRASIQDKENKLSTLSRMITDQSIDLTKLEDCYRGGKQPKLRDWSQFLDSLHR